MVVTKFDINGLVLFEPKIHSDKRGYFYEVFNDVVKEEIGEFNIIQENESKSKFGVLRGLHFQKPPFDQAKLVRCISGEVLDVAVDLRYGSPTYGQYESVILSSDNKKQFFIPRGFAHGFVVLSDEVIFSYKVDNPYTPISEGGILYNDDLLGINWGIGSSYIEVSQKDKYLPNFNNFITPFKY